MTIATLPPIPWVCPPAINPIPVPDVRIDNSESAWALWDAAVTALEAQLETVR